MSVGTFTIGCLPLHSESLLFDLNTFSYLAGDPAQRIAGDADSRTTKLYDRRGQKVLLEDMERIRY
jgi:hypothetical protein